MHWSHVQVIGAGKSAVARLGFQPRASPTLTECSTILPGHRVQHRTILLQSFLRTRSLQRHNPGLRFPVFTLYGKSSTTPNITGGGDEQLPQRTTPEAVDICHSRPPLISANDINVHSSLELRLYKPSLEDGLVSDKGK